MSWGLPKLPGYSFRDVNQLNFHVPRKIDYVNGFPVVKLDYRAVGGRLMDAEGSDFVNVKNDNDLNYSVTYGRAKDDSLPIPKPHWVRYDKKFLTFKGFFVEKFPPEDIIMREIILIYYLEDDTLTVIEPLVKNSGLLQGKLIKRGKIRNDSTSEFWHWKDLKIGIDICILGLDLHISKCDDFTREFMKSQGIDLLEDETVENQQKISQSPCQTVISSKPKRFLDDDGRVLKFDAIWDDTKSEHGELRKYKILYYPFDSSVAIKEFHVKNGGRDPFPMLLRKTKIPKNWKERIVNSPMFGHSPEIILEYYKAEDLKVGETINVLGRNFLLCDCDYDTRIFYKNVLNIEQNEPVSYEKPEIKHYSMNVGPHIGIGDPEDTLMSCLSFHSKPPYKDTIQYNLNANKRLRYICEMISVYSENRGRRFMLWYNLNDGTIRMDEMPAKNSGVPAGRFSGPSKIALPGESFRYYSPEMFYIGAIIIVKNHKFRITDADLFVYHYMKENPEKFPAEIVENIRNYHLKLGNLSFDENLPVISNEGIENVDHQLKSLQIDGSSILAPKDTLKIESEWRPTELPEPLQAIECAMTLPESSEQPNPSENQPIVCLTGPIPDTHEESENIPQSIFQHDFEEYNVDHSVEKHDGTIQIPTAKKVSFKDVSEENT